MSWTAVDALDRERTVVFMLGGPVEQHGPHLPLGTDVFSAHEVQRRVVEKAARAGWQALVAPPLLHGTAVLSEGYPGSTSIRRPVLTEFLVDVLSSFATSGFTRIVTTSQHIDPPYVRAWEDACATVNARYGSRAVHGYERLVLDDVLGDRLGEVLGVDMAGDSHAGTFETAVIRHLRPDLVDDEVVAGLEPIRLDFAAELQQARSFRQLGDGRGYTGDPRVATAAHGAILMNRYAGAYWTILERWLAGEDVTDALAIGGRR